VTTKAEAFRDTAEAKGARIIGRNTFRYTRADGSTCIRLHKTDIVCTDKNGISTINAAGWRTPTTKERINAYAPVRVFQRNALWYVGEVLFFDGIKVDAAGQVLNAPKANTEEKAIKQKKAINAFVKKLDNMPDIPHPNSGDCWLCGLFHPVKSVDRNARRVCPPEITGDVEHIKAHVKEGYLHGSLLVNAMRWRGYDDRAIGLHYSMNLRDTFKRALRRYLFHIYGFAV